MVKKGKKKDQATGDVKVVLRNRRVRHDYEIIDTWEAGVVLAGSEVKSLREGNVQWADAHARMDERGELWLWHLHIGEYSQAGLFNHRPTARRKLLLHRRQLDRIAGNLQTKGLSLVPLEILFRRGWAKVVIALVRGRKKADKRADARAREAKRDIDREMARRQRARM